MDQIKIIYTFTEKDGEEFDNDDNFCGYKTTTKLIETIVDADKVAKTLKSIYETAADYGDGVTDANVLAIVDNETKELLRKDFDFWKIRGDEE